MINDAPHTPNNLRKSLSTVVVNMTRLVPTANLLYVIQAKFHLCHRRLCHRILVLDRL